MYKTSSFRKRIPDILALNEEKINSLKERINVLEKHLAEKKQELFLGVRPEDIVSEQMSTLLEHHSDVFSLFISQAELLGNEYYAYSKIENEKVIAKISANEEVEAKKDRKFAINLDKIHLFDKESTKALF